jgi:hypothetical protein
MTFHAAAILANASKMKAREIRIFTYVRQSVYAIKLLWSNPGTYRRVCTRGRQTDWIIGYGLLVSLFWESNLVGIYPASMGRESTPF